MSAEPLSSYPGPGSGTGFSFTEHTDLVRSKSDIFRDYAHKAMRARDQRMNDGGEVQHLLSQSRDLLQIRGVNWVRAKGELLIAAFKETQAYEKLFDDVKDYFHGHSQDPSIRSEGDLIALAVGGAFAQLGALWLEQTFPELAVLNEDETLVVWNRIHPEARPQKSPFRALGLQRTSVPDGLVVEEVNGRRFITQGLEYTTDGLGHLSNKPSSFVAHKKMESARLHTDALLQMVVPADSLIAKKTDEDLKRIGAGVMEVPIMHGQVKALIYEILNDPRRSIHFLSADAVKGYRDPVVAAIDPLILMDARWQARMARRDAGLGSPEETEDLDDEGQNSTGYSISERLTRAFTEDLPTDLED